MIELLVENTFSVHSLHFFFSGKMNYTSERQRGFRGRERKRYNRKAVSTFAQLKPLQVLLLRHWNNVRHGQFFSNLPDDEKKGKKTLLLKRKQNMKRDGFVLASSVWTGVWVIELITCVCVWELPPCLLVVRYTERATGDCKANVYMQLSMMNAKECVFLCLISFFFSASAPSFVLSDKPCGVVCVLWVNQCLAVIFLPHIHYYQVS